jgi:hypothetical protein
MNFDQILIWNEAMEGHLKLSYYDSLLLVQRFSYFSAGIPLYVTSHIQCTINNYFINLNEKRFN